MRSDDANTFFNPVEELMAFTLRILFGGSIVLVPQAQGTTGVSAGLYALLISNEQMPHDGILGFSEAYVGGDPTKCTCHPLPKNKAVDLRTAFPGGTYAGKVPKYFARISAYQHAVVDPVFMQGPATHVNGTKTNVTSVVQLPPLQKAIDTFGAMARIRVETKNTPTLDTVYGFAKVEYHVDNGKDTISIGNDTLKQQNGLLEIAIINIPQMSSMSAPQANDPVIHAQYYYDILKGAGSSGSNGPDIFVDTPSSPADYAGVCCAPTPSWMSEKGLTPFPAIVPEECTVGVGCPDGTLDCS